LECGSNADNILDAELLSKISKIINIPIIVGGGIKNDAEIDLLAKNGASFIVVGSMIESKSNF
jgi:putative glycerol-1-phosphate prenyltransferase